MADSRNYNRSRRRRRRRGPLGRLISFLVICLVLFLGISVFFKLGEIEVGGSSRYTAEEVIEASGVSYGDHLFFINRSAIATSIRANLPYVDEVTINRHFPNALEITIGDGNAMAWVASDSGYLLLDRHCKILEVASAEDIGGKIAVEGITPILPEEGQTVALSEEERDKVDYLSELLTLIDQYGMAEDVESIDMTLVTDVTFTYQNRFQVLLGTSQDLDYKVAMLAGIVDSLEDYDTGTIDVTQGEPSHFYPD